MNNLCSILLRRKQKLVPCKRPVETGCDNQIFVGSKIVCVFFHMKGIYIVKPSYFKILTTQQKNNFPLGSHAITKTSYSLTEIKLEVIMMSIIPLSK